jgi:hypothetical protein
MWTATIANIAKSAATNRVGKIDLGRRQQAAMPMTLNASRMSIGMLKNNTSERLSWYPRTAHVGITNDKMTTAPNACRNPPFRACHANTPSNSKNDQPHMGATR